MGKCLSTWRGYRDKNIVNYFRLAATFMMTVRLFSQETLVMTSVIRELSNMSCLLKICIPMTPSFSMPTGRFMLLKLFYPFVFQNILSNRLPSGIEEEKNSNITSSKLIWKYRNIEIQSFFWQGVSANWTLCSCVMDLIYCSSRSCSW